MSLRALVTGGTGFLGGTLVRRLATEGWEVHAIVRPHSDPEAVAGLGHTCTVHVHDGSTGQLVQIVGETRPDVVFHLAAFFLTDHGVDDVEPLVCSNLLFAAQLVEAMLEGGSTRLVNAGTSWQHYQTARYRPVNLYAALKQAFEDVLAFYHDACGLSVITLKLFDTYGPGDTRPKVLNALIEAASSGQPVALTEGRELLDLTHAEDVALAFVRAAEIVSSAEAPVSHWYFVSGERYTIRELIGLVEKASGAAVDARMGERPYGPRSVMVPVEAGRRLLPGWQRRFSLADHLAGLARPLGEQQAR